MQPAIPITIYASKTSVHGTVERLPWGDWAQRFLVHDVRGEPSDTTHIRRLDRNKNGPAVVLGEVVGARSKTSVAAAYAIGLDFDAPIPDQDAAPAKNRRELEAFERALELAFEALAPFEYVAYTTHKSGSEIVGGALRLRVILPLAEKVLPGDYPAFWGRVNTLIGGINDPSTKDISRLHFLPSTFDPSKASAWRNEGVWISPADLPEEGKRDDYRSLEITTEVEKILAAIPRASKALPFKGALVALSKGEPFAHQGERHDMILKLTWWIAKKSGTLSADGLRVIFDASLRSMWPGEDISDGIQAVATAYAGAVERLAELTKESIERGTEVLHKDQAGDLGSYTSEELEQIAAVQKCSIVGLEKRWILTKDGAHWFLQPDGEYNGPHSAPTDVAIASRQTLARSPVPLRKATKNGYIWVPLQDAGTKFGSVAQKVVSDMIEPHTYFDAETRTLHEAVRPLRPLEPKFDERIDEWLKLLAGPLHGKIVDWLSCAPDLGKLLCAIYFDGAPGGGKTLFATGVSRLWTDGPPGSIKLALSGFNDEIARCPLLLADEQLPKKWGQDTVTTELREMISTFQRTLTRKYRAPAEMRGAVRLVLTANNEFLLDSKDVSTQADIEAIAQRFLYVKTPKTATVYLESLPKSVRQAWADGGIAQHALWLQANHEIEKPGARFLVEGDVSDMHLLLVGGSLWNSFALEWCIGYAMDPNLYDREDTGLIRCGDGELFVNTQAIVDGWATYIKNEKFQPTYAKASQALRAISDGKRAQKRYKGKQIWYYPISVEMLLTWSDRLGKGDRQTILENLGDPAAKELIAEEQDTTEDLGSVPPVNPTDIPF